MSRLRAKIRDKRKIGKEKRKINEIKGAKEKFTSQSWGQGNYASFSGFNWTRTTAPCLTVKGLILYAKYVNCLRLLNFLMQKEWRNEEKRKKNKRIKGKKWRTEEKDNHLSNPKICFSGPNRAWTHAYCFTVIGLITSATDACCFWLFNWLHTQNFGHWFLSLKHMKVGARLTIALKCDLHL